VPRVEHYLLLIWATFTGVIVFCFVVAWNEGLLLGLVASDRSKISVLIALLYIFGMYQCARRILYVSHETESAAEAEEMLTRAAPCRLAMSGRIVCIEGGAALPAGLLHDYFADLMKMLENSKATAEEMGSVHTKLPDLYAGKLKGPHEIGWFLADVMLKLGLLGTIIGFILMLGSVADTSSLDANTMQKVLRQMSSGMGTALYTTLAGLLSSVLMAVQYQMLERGSDQLLEKIVHLAEIQVSARASS